MVHVHWHATTSVVGAIATWLLLVCGQAAANCGTLPDGCGGSVSCGSCTAPQTFAGGGVANVCGSGATCTPTTCQAQGKNSGTISDGCAGTLSCGTCSGSSACTANVCTTCVPVSYRTPHPSAMDPQSTPGTLSCGQSCPAGQTCGGGGFANACGSGGPPAWENIPPAVSTDFNNPPNNYGFMIILMDPTQHDTLYVSTNYQGIWKTTDRAATWFRVDRPLVGSVPPGCGQPSGSPLDARIWSLAMDRSNPQTLYATNGYGCLQGLFKSTDGGVSWAYIWPRTVTIGGSVQPIPGDVNMITTDPYLKDHLVVTGHSDWSGAQGTGYVESFDGGATWTGHYPTPDASTGATWGHGTKIYFMDNSSTMLMGSPSSGFWKSADGGATWKLESTTVIGHGGGTSIYHAANGDWYAAGHAILRSTDDGETWAQVGYVDSDDYGAVMGDGATMYSMPTNTGLASGGPHPYYTSSETDGTTWVAYSDQTFANGPYSMMYDDVNHIIYSSNFLAGVWRLQTPP